MLQSTFINTQYLDCILVLRIPDDPQTIKLIIYPENTYISLDGNLRSTSFSFPGFQYIC